MRHRFHLLALPHTRLDDDHLSCAYTQKVVKFINMMAGLHEIILYGPELIPLANGHTEHVVCIKEEERKRWFGGAFDTVKTPFMWSAQAPYWSKFTERAIPAILERAQQGDFVLCTSGGDTQLAIAESVKHATIPVEWAVGYEGIVQNFAAFESYCWMHHVYGLRQWRNGRAFDAVVPNFFNENDFLPVRAPDDPPYLLFLGRVTARKGPHIAGQIAKRLGMKLVVAGPGAFQMGKDGKILGDQTEIEGDVEYVGEVGAKRRAELIAGASCMLSPTLYVEPFGGSAVEAMFGGCPVVASDWGAFTETVTPETGRRFRTLRQGCEAVLEAMQLDRDSVARAAKAKYSLDAVRPKFERWFEQLTTLWENGWYA
jgi:glycosyltransferase involved in cell wall biosynthesis